ncbi:MAG: hypothetical protein VKK04_03835 [Synechococcales bacterium]|nr:hypothetical protein [Synechococcales bacterium]
MELNQLDAILKIIISIAVVPFAKIVFKILPDSFIFLGLLFIWVVCFIACLSLVGQRDRQKIMDNEKIRTGSRKSFGYDNLLGLLVAAPFVVTFSYFSMGLGEFATGRSWGRIPEGTRFILVIIGSLLYFGIISGLWKLIS